MAQSANDVVKEVLDNWDNFTRYNNKQYLDPNKIVAATGCSKSLAYQVKYRAEFLHGLKRDSSFSGKA